METKEAKEVSARSAPEKILKSPASSEKKEAQKSSEQITTTTKQTIPKNPGRIAAGKNLLNTTKKQEKQRRNQTQTLKSKQAKKKTLHQVKTRKTNKAAHFHSLKFSLLPALLCYLQDCITRGKN